MRASLGVAFVDAAARSLRWRVGDAGSRRAPLAALETDGPGLRVELGVLGASHQVCFGDHVEVVACGTGGDPLPATAARQVGALRYRFRSSVEHLEPAAFDERVAGLVERYRDRPDALVASFPGHDTAVTILAFGSRGAAAGWRTWHAYPQTGELVATATDVGDAP